MIAETLVNKFEHHLDQELGFEAVSFADRGLQVKEIAQLLARSEPVVREALEGQQRPLWIPTPDEIVTRAAEIRAGWSEDEKHARRR
ncbi:hypothetical protein [Rosistilla oblonga]|uniref:hypothetical protein n=1 Tax=Rosistilla oblonga TaxID=2527990 RepID=UPI003A971A25